MAVLEYLIKKLKNFTTGGKDIAKEILILFAAKFLLKNRKIKNGDTQTMAKRMGCK